MTGPTFSMLCCAVGAEKAVKKSMADDGWRLAFSRPGFVTAKHDEHREPPTGIFIRTSAASIGTARSDDSNEQIATLIQSLENCGRNGRPFDQLHVWPKDRVAIGRFDFEPVLDEVSKAIADQVFDAIRDDWLRCDAPNRIAQPDESVLDVVLVEPAHWFFGVHTADHWPSRWPGGVQPMSPENDPVSRAYYKAAEAITWSGFDMQAGDLVAEVGSAPGGACGRLLELGFRVIGIDPANMDERISGHPKFRHIRARAEDLPRKEFRGVKWLLVDSNVKPYKTLRAVGDIVSNRNSDIEGMLLTMKLGDYKSSELIQSWVDQIQSWGASEIRVRQLARNKCEVCIAVRM